MTEAQAIQLLKDDQAFLEGHFRLSSGLHSGEYIQCAQALQYPKHAELLCAALAENLKAAGCPLPDVVIGPALGAIIVGYELARQLGVKSYFAERADEGFALRRGFALRAGEKVLIAENTITTGGSPQKVVELAQQAGAEVLGVATLVDRTGGKHVLTVPLYALVRLATQEYTAEECPLCAKGRALVKPGSKPDSS